MGLGLDRRSVLLGAALLPLAACTSDAPPPPDPPPDPDDLLRSAAVDRERALLAQYDAVLAAVPALAVRLAPVRDEHAEHLRALLPPEPTAGPTATPAPAGSTPAPPSPTAGATAQDPAAALAALVAGEAAAGAAHGSAALEASPDLAGVLASLAASEASHRVVLG